MLSCSFTMFGTTANSQTSSEEEMIDFDTVEPTVMFGSRAGSKKGKPRAFHYNARYHTPFAFVQSLNWVGVKNFQKTQRPTETHEAQP